MLKNVYVDDKFFTLKKVTNIDFDDTPLYSPHPLCVFYKMNPFSNFYLQFLDFINLKVSKWNVEYCFGNLFVGGQELSPLLVNYVDEQGWADLWTIRMIVLDEVLDIFFFRKCRST